LSGFEPDADIPIEFIGLRPGEKLYEELITEGEGVVATDHQKILVLRPGRHSGEDRVACHAQMQRDVEDLAAMAERRDGDAIRRKLRELVPEYVVDLAEQSAAATVKAP
jgi:FlaA1/EpsC-like NDP-sugar epimerase